jgi:hypothetical protein
MDHYAGLDVSLEETAIGVVDGTGRIVKEVRAASEPEALIAALRAIDLPLALYEAAHTLLIRSRKWSALRAWGMKVAKARGMARPRRGGPQACCHSASDVERRDRVPLRQGTRPRPRRDLNEEQRSITHRPRG